MYYILNAAKQPQGPYPAEWIRANARADTLVSSGQTWIKYAAHPDFKPTPSKPAGPAFCSECGGALRPGVRFCTKCGKRIANPGDAAAETAAVAFQHPLDISATLAKTPGIDVLAKFMSASLVERLMNIQLVGHSVRVDETQYPRIYRLYLTAARRLGIRRLPDLYVTHGEDNAGAIGMDKFYIMIGTGLLELLEEDELMAVLAHELGHVKCEHMRYMTMVELLRKYGRLLLDVVSIPLAPALFLGVEAALVMWYQKAELSCDRAALLVTRDVSAVERALGKLTGFSSRYTDALNIERLKQQATQFDEIGNASAVEKALKVWTLLQETHPVPVMRIREIAEWANSAQYATIAATFDAETSTDGAHGCARCGSGDTSVDDVFCAFCGGGFTVEAAT